MNKYDYLKAVIDDVKQYIIDNNIDVETLDDTTELYDDMFVDDAVTGNASGSYTFSRWEAEEKICHNLDLLEEALEEFGYNGFDIIDKGAETADVLIRCYILGQAIDIAIEELRGGDK